MKSLHTLSDDEIDELLQQLFNDKAQTLAPQQLKNHTLRVQDLTHDDLLRIRSRNHPDKWPNVNQAAYQAAIEELDRRRNINVDEKL